MGCDHARNRMAMFCKSLSPDEEPSTGRCPDRPIMIAQTRPPDQGCGTRHVSRTPSLCARTRASARELTPSLRYNVRVWVLIVFTDRNVSAAIAAAVISRAKPDRKSVGEGEREARGG